MWRIFAILGLGFIWINDGLRRGVFLAIGLLLVNNGLPGAIDWDDTLLTVEVLAVEVDIVESSFGGVDERPDAKNTPNQIFLPLEMVDSGQGDFGTAPLGCGHTSEAEAVEGREHHGGLETIREW